MKTISFFVPSLNIGGIERVFITYANYLSNSYNVHILTCHSFGDLEKNLSLKIKVYSFNCSLKSCLIKLAKYLRDSKVDVVITGGDIPNAFAIIANCISLSKTKIVISQHNYLNVEQNMLFSLIIYRYLYGKAFKILAVSEGIRHFLIEKGLSENSIVTIYNPIDIENILCLSKKYFVSEDNFILYAGRLTEVKNLHFLIDAFELVKSSEESLKLVIIGDGSMKSELEEYISKSKYPGDIVLKGMMDNPFPYVSSSRFIVLSSFSEAFPTVILESFALGKKVVSTPNEGAKELINDSRLGYVSQSFDVNEYSQLLKKTLTDTNQIEYIKSIADFYDVHTISNNLLNVIRL
jgi:GalNAc-alpha-(1->4)-GalNAc-alpha-(1->3)-diNAcBac-PP-undecaprenol alpha-1,4-N-acetyl-D-galactosaminyltransferase